MANYQYRPPKADQPPTVYRTPNQYAEKEIAKENLYRQKRIRELYQQYEEEENYRIYKALQEKHQQIQQITEDARKVQRVKAEYYALAEQPPDPKQQAYSDFYNFLSRVQAAAGIPIPPVPQIPAQYRLPSRKQSARTPKPVVLSGQSGPKDVLVLSPPQLLDNERIDVKNSTARGEEYTNARSAISGVDASKISAQASILENPPEVLIPTSQDSSYDFPLDASIKETEKLEVMQLDYDSADQDEKQRQKELIDSYRQRISSMAQERGVSFSVIEQAQKFKQEKARQDKVKQALSRQPPKAPPKPAANTRLSLEIKQLTEYEKRLEQEVMKIDEKLYSVEGLSNCSLIQRYNFLSPGTDGCSIFEVKQTEDDVVKAVAQYDADGQIQNKDEVAKAISDFKRRQSRGIIEQSVKGKVRKMMEVKRYKLQAPSPSKQEAVYPHSTVDPVAEHAHKPNQVALEQIFGVQSQKSAAQPSAPTSQNDFDENAFFAQELADSIKQKDVFSTAPQVDLSRAVKLAQEKAESEARPRTALKIDPLQYTGELNNNYHPSVIEESSDSQYGDIYASMNSVEMRRASVAHYEAPCDEDDVDPDEDYDFENM